MKITTKQQAIVVLNALEAKDFEFLESMGVRVFGNKGRMWSKTACITNLDGVKGQCNPRLSFNSCLVEDVGCPECLGKLKEMAGK